MSNFRKELKYKITNSDFCIINHNLNGLIKKDSNCKGDLKNDKKYLIIFSK